MRQIVIDTETTGFDFQRDKIVEVGCVELRDLLPTGRTYHAYCNPGIPVPLAAQEVHGLTDAFLSTQPPFAAAPLIEFLDDSPIIAHNAAFDMGFLSAELAAGGHGPLPNQIIDSLALARSRHPGAPCSLDALCRRYSVSTAARTKHGALLDAELLAAVYIELVGRQATMDLAAPTASTNHDWSLPVRAEPLPARLTDADLAAHQAMLSGILNNIWPS
jgi:DNA polymerase-3 subunit epsilon